MVADKATQFLNAIVLTKCTNFVGMSCIYAGPGGRPWN